MEIETHHKPPAVRGCSIEGCQRPHKSKGLCGTHYARLRLTGSTELAERERTDPGCAVEGCDKPHLAKGLCQLHYHRQRETGSTDLQPRGALPPKTCSVEGCDDRTSAKGYCGAHYARWRKYGTTDLPEQRVLVRRCSEEGCNKEHHSAGLCQAHYRQKRRRERGLKKPGPVPQPDAPTSRYNPVSKRAATEMAVEKSTLVRMSTATTDVQGRSTRTHCANGHLLDDENLYVRPSDGHRACRICGREAQDRYRVRHGLNKGPKTHCRRGHEYTPENTLQRTDGGRACKACAKHRNLIKKYGITLDEFEVMLTAQDGVCAICQRELDMGKHTHLDHDHDTGDARGILCHGCNVSIGHLRTPEALRRAALYLEGELTAQQPQN